MPGKRGRRISKTIARLILALVVGAAVLASAPPAQVAAAGQDEPAVADPGPVITLGDSEPVSVDLGDDIVVPLEPPADSRFRRFAAAVPTDPLGLVENLDQIQLYTAGTDTFEVWKCQDPSAASFNLTAKVAEANANITPYYQWLSNNAYTPVFVEAGTVPPGTNCQDYIAANSSGTANAALAFGEWGGGWAGPGTWCYSPCPEANKKFPANYRYGQIGVSVAFLAVLAHEMAHTIYWPHSFTGNRTWSDGVTIYEYDNAIDVMSGNRGVFGGGSYGTYPDPYATLAINRYAAGWIDTTDVAVHNAGTTEVVLSEIGDAGTEMLVINDTTGYWTLDTRVRSANDPFPSVWEGVHVARIDKSSPFDWGITRRTIPEPPVPFMDTFAEYGQPLDHVLRVGESLFVGGNTIEIVAREGDAFRVKVTSNRFADVPASHTFYNDIEWLAVEGITKGCNPPGNTLYCPSTNVTRGQMAAFLVRALSLPAASQNYFTDDDTSIFETDINRLAQAGITKGCNPPANTLYCPDSKVSREQMAAFLVRALGLTDDGGGNTFIDDDGSIFEADIAKLAAAGITKGCNPPANTKFCPTNTVTREQMAAFLHRALPQL